MNLLYLSLSYIPSRRASSVHVMRMCAALTRAGHKTELVAKRGMDPLHDGKSDHAFYGVEPTFGIIKLPYPEVRGGGMVFAAGVVATLLARYRRAELVYAREVIGAVAAAELGMPVVFESHGVPEQPAIRALTLRLVRSSSLRGLVVISDSLRRDMEAAGMVPSHAPVIVAHDAADLPATEPRKLERASHARPRLGYVGSLYPGRGIEMLREIAAAMPDCDVEVVGGTEPDLRYWRAQQVPENLHFAGFAAPRELARLYITYDVLLMPYARRGIQGATRNADTSRWASPMKMFEYMASGIPIVASDLPVLGEVLRDGTNALIAAADDVSSWQAAIRRLLEKPELASRLSACAHRDLVEHHTWDARVRRIVEGLGLS